MTALDWLLIAALAVVSANAVVWRRNLRAFAAFPGLEEFSADERAAARGCRLAVCVPARNEAGNIEACVRSVLANDLPGLRVLVYDDGSTDGTGAIVERLAAGDERVSLVSRCSLPEGWNGKQHGLWRCALEAFALDATLDALPEAAGKDAATHCLFIDADVRVKRDACERALAQFYRLDARARTSAVKGRGGSPANGLGVLSCFPRQLTGTLSEAAVVPLIFFLLLSYLPFGRMRSTVSPSASAACGQFIVVSRGAYVAFGGHEPFKASMHDGIKMPRVARRAGYHTDVYDGSDSARVRMYRGFGEVWRGFAKNAYEGLGNPVLLVFLTVVHAVGHVLPPLLVIGMLAESLVSGDAPTALAYLLGLAAWTVPVVQRVVTADRLGHAAIGALVHPFGTAIMIGVQWRSFYLHVTGKRTWRGRDASGAEVGASVGAA